MYRTDRIGGLFNVGSSQLRAESTADSYRLKVDQTSALAENKETYSTGLDQISELLH